MRKGAVFDVDGTLLDSMPIWEDAPSGFLAGFGIKAPADLGRIMFRMSLDEGASYLKANYLPQLSEQEIKDGVSGVVRDFYFFRAQPKPGAGEFLEHMRRQDIPMYVATTGRRELVRAAFERLGFDRYFDGVITCEEVGAGKSSPKIYLEAARRMGSEPDETYVFEDVIHAIRTANRAGFVTVGLYDKSGEGNQDLIRAESGIYLQSFENWERFRAEAGL